MNKHTPGPWRVKIYKPYRSEAIIVNNDGEIASVDLACMPGAEADAYLIAAAPDMLEALESIAPMLPHGVVDSDPQWAAAINAVRVAIKKARGET